MAELAPLQVMPEDSRARAAWRRCTICWRRPWAGRLENL